MPEHPGEQRQLRVDVGSVAIPTKQRLQDERVSDVVQAGAAAERFPVKAAGAAEPVELAPDGSAMQSPAVVRDQEARLRLARAELVADAGIGVERLNGAPVKRDLARAPVLAAADREPSLGQHDVRAVERDRLADAHAGHG